MEHFVFVSALPFDLDVPPMLKVDDGIEVTSFTLSHIIGEVLSLGTMGVVGALSITLCHFSNIFQMACPSITFNSAKHPHFCYTTFSLPFSLEVLINSFKAS